MARLTETTVIINFLEDATEEFLTAPDLQVELPVGSWTGNKSRSIADIHGGGVPGIEAKGNLKDAKADFENPEKNQGIRHYIYAGQSVTPDEAAYWKNNNVSACVYLTGEERWKVVGEDDGVFRSVVNKLKIIQKSA